MIQYKFRNNINTQTGDSMEQMYNIIMSIFELFQNNDRHKLDRISIDISFIKYNKRHYLYMMTIAPDSEATIIALIQ